MTRPDEQVGGAAACTLPPSCVGQPEARRSSGVFCQSPAMMKVMAREQRINWLKNMVRKRLLVRDIDSFFRSQEEKLRSGEVHIKEEERDILLGLMNIKLRDEKKNYRRLITERENMRKWLRTECGNNSKKYLTVIKKIRK